MSKRLGSVKHARQAKRFVYEYTLFGFDYDTGEYTKLPEGWKHLGSGYSRQAFLAPDGIVYKVAGKGYESLSEREAQKFYDYNPKVVEKSNGKCRLAKSRFFRSISVIAMEYVHKQGDIMWFDGTNFEYKYTSAEVQMLCGVLRDIGFYDIHSENLWLDENGVLTVIDYA